jgi:adenylate cyclase
MAAPRVDCKLAAIMAVDVVGYSRLIGADEAGTLARVRAHRIELAEPLIAEHHGRVVKLTGDGALVEFASAVDAVECAAALQAAMAERETAEPEERRIHYRIGINIGDIVLEDGDIFGDGVNVAARLEGLVEPKRARQRERSVMISAVRPPMRRSCFGSPERFWNGSTAGLWSNSGMRWEAAYPR